jgi:UDP-glucose 4-epimerase
VTNALVVGGAGFIGSHLVDRLLADGVEVDVVDDLSSGSLANLAEARSVAGRLKIHHLDAGGPEAMSLIGMRRPSVIFHLSAVPRYEPTPARHARAFSATVSILDAAREHHVGKVVVPLPATAMYGWPSGRELPLKERPLEPRGVRGVIARATVDLLASYREQHSLEFTALATANVYGPRQRADGGVVAAFTAAAAERTAPVVRGDGRQTRDLLYVDDAVDAIVRSGERGGGLVINIGTGEQTSVSELWKLIAGATAPSPTTEPPRSDDVARFALSAARARIHLGWSSWTSLPDGLSAMR